ncbi:fasciclin-like arabinogalactan protein 19 [Dioscorea cayenensis subsp. rotundata]|uniref:Fasciclin-like arabinogalactan protein 19 n=1 Tax=Dioscorea cayennensis subsp. rotundata TaxID=55577 RepID=A0AB40CHE8_DIOCR|nr:fasciclin-like arabinogalactan protein 19 [Dioscorea cayenensis subsp. rotundata]
MAKRNPAFLLLLALTALFTVAAALSEPELDAALSALNARGYTLFGKAITASDIRFELLHIPNGTYTLFAPTDAALFALDMASPAWLYVRSLRRHIALRRLPNHLLSVLPPGYRLPTLLPQRSLRISRRLPGPFITADDVDVVLPAVFHGPDLVAYGLGGIIPPRHPTDLFLSGSHPRSTDLPNPPSRSNDWSSPPSRSADPPELRPPATHPVPGIDLLAPSPLNGSSPSPSDAIETGTHGAPSPALVLEDQPPISAPVQTGTPSPAGMSSPAPAPASTPTNPWLLGSPELLH